MIQWHRWLAPIFFFYIIYVLLYFSYCFDNGQSASINQMNTKILSPSLTICFMMLGSILETLTIRFDNRVTPFMIIRKPPLYPTKVGGKVCMYPVLPKPHLWDYTRRVVVYRAFYLNCFVVWKLMVYYLYWLLHYDDLDLFVNDQKWVFFSHSVNS